jgi:hypothetical protein
MGYTHSWISEFQGNPNAFARIRADFEKLILPLKVLGCLIAGPDGTGVPDITGTYIHFNGVRHCGHGTVDGPWGLSATALSRGIGLSTATPLIDTPLAMSFVIGRRCDGQCWHDDFWLSKDGGSGSCKTAFKPYDLAVTAALLIAKHHWGEKITIASSGEEAEWSDARQVCQLVLGYGASIELLEEDR